jgi:hypothetical protein
VNEMAELVLSIKLEGEEADLAVLEAWLKSDERLDFSTLALLLAKISGPITISKISEVTTTQEVTSTKVEQLYPKP